MATKESVNETQQLKQELRAANKEIAGLKRRLATEHTQLVRAQEQLEKMKQRAKA